MEDQILTATAGSEQPVLKNVGHKIKYYLDVCRQQMEYILNVNRAQKMDLYFCVVMTVCNSSHHLKSHCTKHTFLH